MMTMTSLTSVKVLAIVLLTLVNPPADTSWPQWGGPRRNFTVDTTGLATTWPQGGPRRLWQRRLGEGHSAIAVDGGRLYTMYRSQQQEKIVAIDAAKGTTVWEYSYEAPVSGLDFSEGAGPHATPLIVGNLLFTMSSRMQLFALDKGTGKVVWSHDLRKELSSPQDDRGYSSSPIAYRDMVIVPAGGPGSSVVAYDQKTGKQVWKGGNFEVAPGSPVLINVNGQDQLVVSGANLIAGVSPVDGSMLWTHGHKTSWGLNISTPVWGEDNVLFVSAAYNNGARALKLTQAAGKTSVAEVWFQNRMRTHIGTVIRLGDFAVGSSGDFGPCPTVAIDMKTGQIIWQNRQFARSTFLYADGKLVILDEDGTLGLATATRSGLNVLARSSILANRAWTVPTLVGTTIYVRDRRDMMALSLGGS